MGLFDTTNAYGGGVPNTQVLNKNEEAELRSLPLTGSKKPEQGHEHQDVFYTLSQEKSDGFNISLGDEYILESIENTRSLNHITHEEPRHITSDNRALPVIVEYQIGAEKKFAYANANQVAPQIINFSGIISENPMFSALAPEGK